MRYDTSPINAVRSALAHAVLAALRVVSALAFLQHGLQKWFGLLLPPDRPWSGPPALLSMTGIAGALEVGGGILLALGLFSRPVAFLLAGEMAFAYFIAHAPRSFWPVLNGGENVVLFCFIFLTIWALGPGRYSVDGLLAGRGAAAGRR